MIAIDLSGKIALVTGGGQGLGASTAALLAEAGARVAINYYADPQGVNRGRAEATASLIGAAAAAMDADVRDPRAVAALFDRCLERFGRLDIVVCNAGIIRDKTIKKMDPEDWQAAIDTNLSGRFREHHPDGAPPGILRHLHRRGPRDADARRVPEVMGERRVRKFLPRVRDVRPMPPSAFGGSV